MMAPKKNTFYKSIYFGLFFSLVFLASIKIFAQTTFQKEFSLTNANNSLLSIPSILDANENTYILANAVNNGSYISSHIMPFNTTNGNLSNVVSLEKNNSHFEIKSATAISKHIYFITANNITKFDAQSASITWSKNLNIEGFTNTTCYSICSDNLNYIYVLGNLIDSNSGNGILFISKIDTSGYLVWTKYIGDNNLDIIPQKIIYKNDRELYLSATGYFNSIFNSSAILVRLDENGNLINSQSKYNSSGFRLSNAGIGLVNNILVNTENSNQGADGTGPTVIETLDSNFNVLQAYQISGFKIYAATCDKNKILLSGQGDVFGGNYSFKTLRLDENLNLVGARQYNHLQANSIILNACNYISNNNNSFYVTKTNQNDALFLSKTDSEEIITCSNNAYTPTVSSITANATTLSPISFTANASLTDETSLNIASTTLITTQDACQKFLLANPLPIELTSFEATSNACNNVITWSTVKEFNTSHFELLRKNKTENQFKPITTIAATNMLGLEKKYSYTDLQVTDGEYEYKLNVVDIDGKSVESKIISTTIHCNTGNPIKVFPIPANDILHVTYNNSKAISTLKIVDILGHVLTTLDKSYAINNAFNIDLTSYTNGTYFLQIVNDETGIEVFKFNIAR